MHPGDTQETLRDQSLKTLKKNKFLQLFATNLIIAATNCRNPPFGVRVTKVTSPSPQHSDKSWLRDTISKTRSTPRPLVTP